MTFRGIILTFILSLSASCPVLAQIMGSEEQAGEILPQPICSFLSNRSEQTIIGTLSTMGITGPDGKEQKFQDNFRLAAGDKRQFCVAGPFFEGRRIELVLRTLMPLFSCKTKIDQEIFLDAKPDENGIKKLSATCY